MCQSRRQSREAKSRNYFYGHGQMGCWCLRNTLLGYVVYGTWVRFRFAWNNREQDSFSWFLVLMQQQTRNRFIELLQLPAWTVTCNFSNFGTNLSSQNRSFSASTRAHYHITDFPEITGNKLEWSRLLNISQSTWSCPRPDIGYVIYDDFFSLEYSGYYAQVTYLILFLCYSG